MVSYKALNTSKVFIAPSIFNDTERQIKFVKADKGLIIRPYKVKDFIGFLETHNFLYL